MTRTVTQDQKASKRSRDAGKIVNLLKTMAWSPWKPILALAGGHVHLYEGGIRAEDSVGSFTVMTGAAWLSLEPYPQSYMLIQQLEHREGPLPHLTSTHPYSTPAAIPH